MFGVEAISLVEYPAIESNWVFFKKQGSKDLNQTMVSLAAIDEEQRTLVGAALIPEKKISRYDESADEEYDVYFSKETVKRASELFLEQNRTNQHTFEHQTAVEGVSVVESWIVEDPERDKSALYNLEVPAGTWMVRVKVDNDDMWQKVKEKNVRGFSVEGYFADKITEMNKPKSMLSRIFQALRKRNFYQEARIQGGLVIATEAEDFTSGVDVFLLDEKGEPTELQNGNYTTIAGIPFEVFGGTITNWDNDTSVIEEEVVPVVEESVAVELDQMKVAYYKHYLKNKFARLYN